MTTRSVLYGMDLPAHRESFLSAVAPAWAHEAAAFFAERDAGWRTMGRLMALFVLAIGLALVGGDWLASVQGVRLPLGALVPLVSDEVVLPPLGWWPWWTLPVGMTIIQIVCRRIRMLRFFWRPSIWYDGLTNSIFLGYALLSLIDPDVARSVAIPICGLLGSALGLGLAVAAEKVVLAAIVILLLRR